MKEEGIVDTSIKIRF